MQRRSPPKHRHDGTSPLPLGMDWSPPPRKWNGRDTVWPHDPHTGWSYCVTIPSWVVRPKSRDSDPVVFYRVQVGVQSPEGVTTTRGVLRRFNDFLKLFTVLKKAFPKKNLPPAPPKGLLRMKTRALLEERRCSLEEWMIKLLSDIDIARSVAVASFLELEAAARFSFQDVNQQNSEASPASNSTVSSIQSIPYSSLPIVAGGSSFTSDYGSDTAYETSELGTPRLGRDDNSEIGLEDLTLDEDLTSPIEKLVKYGMSNIDEGLFMGQTILEQLEGLPRHKMNDRHLNNVIEKDKYNGNSSKASFLVGNGMELFSGPEHGKRRLVTAKTDTEDLIARLNQEIAVKDYLATKVKDLEGELETTKQKSKENLQQALLMERERHTQMQWDMEELRRKSMEMELKLKSKQDEKSCTESGKECTVQEKDVLLQELDASKEQLEKLLKRYEELEAKSKADIKVLIKEVKSLRSSQSELKQELSQTHKAKSEAEKFIQQERQMREHAKASREKLLHECHVLHNRLQECNTNLLADDEDNFVADSSSLADALDLLATCDDRVGLLLSEAQLLTENKETTASGDDESHDINDAAIDDELRKMLADVFVDNARLRKQVNSITRRALRVDILSNKKEDEEAPSENIVVNTSVL
ncbi:hypothetical protein ACJW30_01G105700 [Castanea mollissima]